MKILIIQTAFIGDVVLATPVISELRQQYPDASIDVLVRKGNESLLFNNPAIRKVITWDKKNNKILQLVHVIKKIRAENYDILINLQRFFSTGLLTILSGAKQTAGFDKNPCSVFFSKRIKHDIRQEVYEHEITRNLKLAAEFGAKGLKRPVLYPSAEDYAKVTQYQTGKYFCIAPTSVWFTKQVPTDKWKELIFSCSKKYPDSKIYLLGGSGDRSNCEEIASQFPTDHVVNLAGSLTFLQTAALMKDARMNFVNDSAPLHFASAMNAPVTVFYCSTIPEFGFGPLSDEGKVIEVTGLSCRPCGLHGHRKCPRGHFKCAWDLDMQTALP